MAGHMRLTVWQEAAHEHANGSGDVQPVSMLEDHEQGTLVNAHAWWGKYSAPGFMDQTEVSGPYEHETEAALATFELFGMTGEGEERTDDERECIDMLVSFGIPEHEAVRLVLS